MKKKLKVAVIMGGRSSEYAISIMTGKEVVKNLNQKKYQIQSITLPKSGSVQQLFKLKEKVDIVFIAMYGQDGEDGTVQGLLELLDIQYTGSKILASAIGMDKLFSRKLFIEAGLDVPRYAIIKKGEKINESAMKLDFPLFIQPNNQGSAIGASLVKRPNGLKKAIEKAHAYSNIALVDQYLNGTEVTCAVIGNDSPKALPIVEIQPKHEYFDFESKYDAILCDEIVPANISRFLTRKVKETAIKAYEVVGCMVFGRVDMIIVRNKVYVLEVNTLPGLTLVSLFPKTAKTAGITYPILLDKIINLSLQNVN